MTDPGEILVGNAGDLYGDVLLTPLLSRLMGVVCRLVEAPGGSVSLLNPTGEAYVKVAERGTACRVGESFSLNEGLTGQVVSRQRPVTLLNYAKVKAGHLPVGHPARNGGVVGLPIWWRGRVIGVNVVFAGVPRQFMAHEIDHLEMVTQLAAPGIVLAAERDLGLCYRSSWTRANDRLRPPSTGDLGADGGASEGGGCDGRDGLTPSRVARLLAEVATCVAMRIEEQGGGLFLGGPGQGSGPVDSWRSMMGELLSEPDTGAPPRSQAPSTILPSAMPPMADRRGLSCPLTQREREVLNLLGQGLSDRAIAGRLLISAKTVEKHVGAVLRKTETASRTAAVIRGLEAGWIAGHSS